MTFIKTPILLATGAVLALSACVSDEQAVDMGLATKCEADGTVARLGDPAGRFAAKSTIEVCKGPRRDSYSETTLDLIDASLNLAKVQTQRAELANQYVQALAALRGADLPPFGGDAPRSACRSRA